MEICIPSDFKHNYTIRALMNSSTHEYICAGFLEHTKKKINLKTRIYSLSYLVEGSGTYVDNSGKKYKLLPGTIFHRFPRVKHSSIQNTKAKWQEFCLAFSPGITEMLERAGLIDSQRSVEKIGIAQIWVDRFIDICNEIEHCRPEQVGLVLIKMLDLHQNIILKARKHHRNLNEEIIDEALLYINSTSQNQLDFQQFCKQHGWGYEKFRKTFKLVIGMSPGKYVISQKINKARQLLIVDGDMNIEEIAAKLGYNNIYQFSSQFKKYTGISPKNFREEHSGDID